MKTVLDVSGAAELLFHKEKENKFRKVLAESEWTVAPDLYIPELANMLWKYARCKMFTQQDCRIYIKDGIDYVDEFYHCESYWQEAFDIAVKYDHPVYDIFYYMLARKHEAVLITNDKKLANLCRKNNVEHCF